MKKKIVNESKKQKNYLLNEGIEVINDVERALSNTHCIYFIDFGTLLGAVRDHKFIAWDCDVDYAVVVDENFKWEDLEKKLLINGLKKVRQFTLKNEITEQTYQISNLTVDIFAHFNSEKEGYFYYYYRDNKYIYNNNKEYHAVRVTTPIISKTLDGRIENIVVKIPYNSEMYLESVYSKNWKIPDSKWNGSNMENRKIVKEKGILQVF